MDSSSTSPTCPALGSLERMAILTSTDSRRRASLGYLNRDYAMTEQSFGTAIPEPAVVMSPMERRFSLNTELREQIDYARANLEQRVRHQRRRLADAK